MQRFQVPYNIKEIPEIQEYLKFAFEESSKRSGDIQDLYRRRYVKLHSGVHSFMLIPVLASWLNPVDLQTYQGAGPIADANIGYTTWGYRGN